MAAALPPARAAGDAAAGERVAFNTADLDPDWSPDGRVIAFASNRLGGGLHVIRADGKTLRRVFSGVATDPDWSPDGRRTAFVARRGIFGRMESTEEPLIYRAEVTAISGSAGRPPCGGEKDPRASRGRRWTRGRRGRRVEGRSARTRGAPGGGFSDRAPAAELNALGLAEIAERRRVDPSYRSKVQTSDETIREAEHEPIVLLRELYARGMAEIEKRRKLDPNHG